MILLFETAGTFFRGQYDKKTFHLLDQRRKVKLPRYHSTSFPLGNALNRYGPAPISCHYNGWLPIALTYGFSAIHSGASSMAWVYRFTPDNGSLKNAGNLLIPFNMFKYAVFQVH